MIQPKHLVDALAAYGFDLAVSVPCSSLAGLLDALITDARFVHLAATSEAEAVAIAAGAYLAGRDPILVMQNSGFCDALSVIGSLLDPFNIPLPMLVSGRGAFGHTDEPQHRLIGANFRQIAQAFDLPFQILEQRSDELSDQIARFRRRAAESGRGAVLAIPPGLVANNNGRSHAEPRAGDRRTDIQRSMTSAPKPRPQVITALRTGCDNAVFVATTGHTGRELFAAGDDDTNIYLAGSMGCASAVGLGLALFGARGVVVLDGDGAMLMRMGNCGTIGSLGPSKFAHIVLNNGAYASTGGQTSLGRSLDLAAIAHACGYARVIQTTDYRWAAKEAEAAVVGERASPLFIDLWVSSDSLPVLPRPVVAPAMQTVRLRSKLRNRQPGKHAERQDHGCSSL